MLELGVRRARDADGRAGLGRQFAVAGDVVGVEVCEKGMGDGESETLGFFEVEVDVALRVNHRATPRRLAADQVGCMRQPFQKELLKQHPMPPQGHRAPRCCRLLRTCRQARRGAGWAQELPPRPHLRRLPSHGATFGWEVLRQAGDGLLRRRHANCHWNNCTRPAHLFSRDSAPLRSGGARRPGSTAAEVALHRQAAQFLNARALAQDDEDLPVPELQR